MRPSEALEMHRSEIRRVVEGNRARNPRVFGSVLRGEDTDGSDLDLLVDPIRGETSLLDIAAIAVGLEELLRVKVDVLTPDAISTRYRDHILSEAVPV
jgi:predicted nucleotidyltransferase